MRTAQAAGLALGIALTGCGEATIPSAPAAHISATFERRGGDDGGLSAEGDYRFTIGAAVFGTTTPIQGRVRFAVEKSSAGSVSGRYRFVEDYDGLKRVYSGTLTCFNLYDFDGLTNNRAKVGGTVDESNDPAVPEGSFLWWQAIDDQVGHHDVDPPGKTTAAGTGDQAANEAFCNSSKPPRFGPFPIRGEIEVRR